MGEVGTWIAAFVALLGTIVSISVSIAGYNRDNKHDTSSESQQMGRLLQDMSYIRESMDQLRTKIEKQEQMNLELERNFLQEDKAVEKLEIRVDTLAENVAKLETRIEHIENEGGNG